MPNVRWGLAFCVLILVWAASQQPASAQNQFEQLYSQYQQAMNAGRGAEAERAAKAYLQLAQQSKQGVIELMGWRFLAGAMTSQHKYKEADQAFHSALQVAQRLPQDESVQIFTAEVFRGRGSLYAAMGRFPDAVECYEEVIKRYIAQDGEKHEDLWMPLFELASAQLELHRLDDVEKTLGRMDSWLKLWETPPAKPTLFYLDAIARLRNEQYRYEEALDFYRQEIALDTKVNGKNSPTLATVLSSIGLVLTEMKNFGEAEDALKSALALSRTHFGEASLTTAKTKELLGGLYRKRGRYAEAEQYYRESIATAGRIMGPEHPLIVTRGKYLGHLYSSQERHADALPLFVAAYRSQLGTVGEKHPATLIAAANVGNCLTSLGRYDEAEQILKDVIAACAPDSPGSIGPREVLGKIYRLQGKLELAESTVKETIALQERIGDAWKLGSFLSYEFASLGLIYGDMNRWEDALQYQDKALHALSQGSATPEYLALAYGRRADAFWHLQKDEQAQHDLLTALDLADQQRANYSGSDLERSDAFMQVVALYEHMVRLQTRRHDLNAALEAMERGRARSLWEQMMLQGVDLLKGLPADQSQRLQNRRQAALTRTAVLEKQLEELTGAEQDEAALRKQAQRLLTELRAAQQEFAQAEADIRNASPIFRAVVGEDQKPVSLQELSDYAKTENSLVMRYLVGGDNTYLLAIPPQGQPQLITLQITAAQAEALRIEPGPLSGGELASLVSNRQQTGVLQLLRHSQNKASEEEAVKILAQLWDLLIPSEQQQQILSAAQSRLVIIPDGPLSLIPFEALVVESEDDPTFLLDVGPPITYSPSATILLKLSANSQASMQSTTQNVLSVGDPAYAEPNRTASSSLLPNGRYRALGGDLKRLPFSGQEATWVRQIFEKTGAEVQHLVGDRATETAVCMGMKQANLIHLACHGLTDASYGNLFGALAIAPERSRPADPAADGFLTLAEIYELDLSKCHLAILSACDTNSGPTQMGEGVWALSRGFLVAGCERVVASNWVVDDKAAASMISYFCSYLAQSQEKNQRPDYVLSLHKARKWVRDQEQWRSPYYWASFVHVGPN